MKRKENISSPIFFFTYEKNKVHMSEHMRKSLKSYLVSKEGKKVEHYTYRLPVSILKEDMNVVTWKHNRPVDLNRVYEIRKFYKDEGIVLGIIFLGYRKGKFICYDGNHRCMALSSRYISYVTVDIMWDISHSDIETFYRYINKSISVPELYGMKERHIREVRGIIDKWMEDLCQKYKTHVSNNENPHRPNFNRSKMMNEIITFYKEYRSDYTVEQILKGILTLNKRYSQGDLIGSKNISGKCLKTGFYIYCAESTINESHLLSILRQDKE